MLLLSWQLATSIDFPPLTKLQQSRCVGPPFLFLRRWVVVGHQHIEGCTVQYSLLRSANTLPWQSAAQLDRNANSGAVLTSPGLCSIDSINEELRQQQWGAGIVQNTRSPGNPKARGALESEPPNGCSVHIPQQLGQLHALQHGTPRIRGKYCLAHVHCRVRDGAPEIKPEALPDQPQGFVHVPSIAGSVGLGHLLDCNTEHVGQHCVSEPAEGVPVVLEGPFDCHIADLEEDGRSDEMTGKWLEGKLELVSTEVTWSGGHTVSRPPVASWPRAFSTHTHSSCDCQTTIQINGQGDVHDFPQRGAGGIGQHVRRARGGTTKSTHGSSSTRIIDL